MDRTKGIGEFEGGLVVAKSKPGAGKVQCPYCKEWVTAGATRCPHCQADYTPADISTMKAANKSNLVGCAVLAVVLVLGASFCSMASTKSIPEKPEATAKQDAEQFYKSVIGTGSACDRAFTVAGTEMKKGDAVRSYRAAQVAENECLGVSSTIRGIEVPTSVGKDAHAKLTEARDQCSTLYTNKWSAVKEIAEVVGGEGNVAKMASIQSTLEQVQSGTIMCVAGMMGPLTTLGIDLETLKVE